MAGDRRPTRGWVPLAGGGALCRGHYGAWQKSEHGATPLRGRRGLGDTLGRGGGVRCSGGWEARDERRVAKSRGLGKGRATGEVRVIRLGEIRTSLYCTYL